MMTLADRLEELAGNNGPVVLTREVFDFLMGVGSLEGVHFGEMHESLPGRFWWRTVLRAAERETPTIIAALRKDQP